jgi:hypothetical protein
VGVEEIQGEIQLVERQGLGVRKVHPRGQPVVTAKFPLGTLPATCNPTGTQPFTLAACCPQLIGPLNASADPADPTNCIWIFSAQVSNPNNAPVSFQWTFHDGTTATSAAPQVTHKYAFGSTTTGPATITLKSPPSRSRSRASRGSLNRPAPPSKAKSVRWNQKLVPLEWTYLNRCAAEQVRHSGSHCLCHRQPRTKYIGS